MTAARPLGLRPLGTDQGATIALAALGDRTLAFVADEDARAIVAIDADAHTELARTPAGGVPSQLLVTPEGRVIVLLRDASELRVFELEDGRGALSLRAKIATPKEPVGIAMTPDHATFVVTAGWGRALAAYDAQSLAQRFRVALPREPRSVVVSDDGATAFVSHAVGSVVSEVDLKAGVRRTIAIRGDSAPNLATARASKRLIARQLADGADGDPSVVEVDPSDGIAHVGCQGFALAKSIVPAGRILAPQVMVNPGNPAAASDGYGDSDSESGGTELPAVVVLDAASGEPVEASLAGLLKDTSQPAATQNQTPCLLPRAATVDPKSHSLLVACFGIDSVIAYDAASPTPAVSEKRRWSVGAGPTGIAVDPTGERAIVWSQFDRSLTWIDPSESPLADDAREVTTVATHLRLLPTDGISPELVLGRYLFHITDDPRIAQDGRACASCHPDGRDDAITWATPNGPRRSIMLAGRVSSSAPYSWNGNSETVRGHLAQTFERLKGAGLKSMELDALVAYVGAMPAPPKSEPSSDPKVVRGSAIFASTQAGCTGCHSGEAFTDGKMHDVKSKAASDSDGHFNTPSLRFVSGTGPYFHDGRYATLRGVLRGSDGTMGHTGHLADDDIDALEAYLRTL